MKKFIVILIVSVLLLMGISLGAYALSGGFDNKTKTPVANCAGDRDNDCPAGEPDNDK